MTNFQPNPQPFLNRPNQNKFLPKPTPMSISTRQTTRLNRPYFNNNNNTNNFQNLNCNRQTTGQPPNFTVEELYNTNTTGETFNPVVDMESCASLNPLVQEPHKEPWRNTSQQNVYYEDAEAAEFQVNHPERNFPRTAQVNNDI